MSDSIFSTILIISIFCALVGCSGTTKLPVKPNEHMEIGWTPRTVLATTTYAWFDSGYTAYQPSGNILTQLSSIKDSLSFLVLYGTWCSDSKRELPHFFKIMDSLKIHSDKITLYAVDRTLRYPPGLPEEYQLTRVPTFILQYRGMEVGRIVEQPVGTLEEDILNQLLPLTQ
ncbi:MAG: thioredoxin [Bacteroidetes bacterium]|nr:MAG: thioredoxin [Bacteroidota bacterium]